ncbi:MAG: hypothetical protein ACLTG2_05770 [Clostridia bacterium]
MKKCPHCNGIFSDDFEKCPQCDMFCQTIHLMTKKKMITKLKKKKYEN